MVRCKVSSLESHDLNIEIRTLGYLAGWLFNIFKKMDFRAKSFFQTVFLLSYF